MNNPADSMATSSSPTPEERYMDGYFKQIFHRFPKESDFQRAKATFQSSQPDTITGVRIQDVKEPGGTIMEDVERLVVAVKPKGVSGPGALTTAMKLHKVHSPSDKVRGRGLYKELLALMHVQKCEEEARKDKVRLIAWCEPLWYRLDECHGFNMEYFPEGTLRDLPGGGLVDGNERLRLLRNAARGLKFLNSIGILQWDVKICNICVFIRGNGTRSVKLIDFGSVKFIGQQVDVRRLNGDTACYRPPELFPRSFDPDKLLVWASPLSDSWRFGMCILEVMTERTLPVWNQASHGDHMYDEFVELNRLFLPNAREQKAGYPLVFPGLDTSKLPECALKLLSNLLRPKPTERYNMEQVIKVIDLHLDGKPPHNSSGKAEAFTSSSEPMLRDTSYVEQTR
eukprot:scpid53261/ scgid14307/ Serine/threonine-protein kinase SBK1; SH3-binding kinase 1